MSNISNLYSLLNTPFYIEQNYASAQLPLLLNLIKESKGTSDSLKKDQETNITFINIKGTSSNSNNSGKQVAILSIKNPIVKHNQFCGPQGTKSMTKELESLKNNDAIAGVVLDIDSGGGQAYGTPEFHDYLIEFKKQKPLVAYTDGLMCSAAYYIGSASTHIIANKRAEAIGSIGAYTQILDLTGYYEKEGAKIHTIYATESTEKNKAYRDALEGNYESYIKQELDPLVSTFVNDMQNARPNIDQKVFKGGTFNASKSLDFGLIDQLGTLQNAIDKVFELSNTNTNTNTMSKNYTAIQETLGLDVAFESNNDAGFFLSEEQMETLENKISGIPAQIEAATKPLNEKITGLEGAAQIIADNQTAIATAISTALTTAEITEELTGAEAITALANKVVEFGQLDGAQTTKPINDANENNTGQINVVGGIDISEAMNN